MKALSMITGLSIMALTAIAQVGNVKVTFRGNANHQITIDGNLYSSANYTTAPNGNRVLTIPQLEVGQHTLQVLGMNNRRVGTTTTFTLRPGYDMNITINNRGGISLQERAMRPTTTDYRASMSSTNFNNLVAQVKAKRGQTQKYSLANRAVTAETNYFTSAQVAQLISLLNGEAHKLQVAKNAYGNIIDPTNITAVYDMLRSTSSRNELQSYIRTYNAANGISTTGTVTTNTAMADASFNTLVNNVRGKWLPGAKLSELTNIFNNTGYFFTASQAQQLIQLVSDESNRLHLAKAAYRSIVDPANVSLIFDLLASQASRTDLEAYIRSYNGNTVYTPPTTVTPTRVAMADNEYTMLVDDVRDKWLPGAKMAALTNIVNNATYNFTAVQARGLIQLVSDENNRLQLSKSVYARLVDPANYTLLHEILASQASRNELDVYVRSIR